MSIVSYQMMCFFSQRILFSSQICSHLYFFVSVMSMVCKCHSSEWKQLPCHKYSMSPLPEKKRHSWRKNFVHRLWSPYVQHYTVKEEAYQNVFRLMRSDRYSNGVQKDFFMNGGSLSNQDLAPMLWFLVIWESRMMTL